MVTLLIDYSTKHPDLKLPVAYTIAALWEYPEIIESNQILEEICEITGLLEQVENQDNHPVEWGRLRLLAEKL